jgi:hypothetical protein
MWRPGSPEASRPRPQRGLGQGEPLRRFCGSAARAARSSGTRPGAGCPVRKLIGDPFDFSRRTVLPSIDTLTIRRGSSGSASLVLHRRDSGSVAVAGDMLHVMPCGVFQPSSVLPAAQVADFDLWRNIMREYSEEFLGAPEAEGDGAPIDYAGTEPFATLDAARRDGRVRVYCLGFGLDALTLVGEILTVAVFDADVYDQLFGDMVTSNSEGTIAATEVPFEEHTVRRLLSGRPHALAPAAAWSRALRSPTPRTSHGRAATLHSWPLSESS